MPAFSVADQNGNIVTNEQLVGKKTVIYFYPKDSTPGCTAEACSLRDNYQRFLAEGYQVYGVSKDSQKSHQNFIAKYDLPFPLLWLLSAYHTVLAIFGYHPTTTYASFCLTHFFRTPFLLLGIMQLILLHICVLQYKHSKHLPCPCLLFLFHNIYISFPWFLLSLLILKIHAFGIFLS